jgi:hypothetical protein
MVETGTQIGEADKPNKDACTWAMLSHIFGLGWLVFPFIPIGGFPDIDADLQCDIGPADSGLRHWVSPAAGGGDSRRCFCDNRRNKSQPGRGISLPDNNPVCIVA